MRQTSPPENPNQIRSNGRVTRCFSNLPKEVPKVESSSSSEEQSESESPPKTKKIHHMTLKAMERRRLLEEQGINLEEEKQIQKPPPRKRGRPKGSKKVQKEDKEEYQINMEESIEVEEPASGKKQINLRKRGVAKKMIDPSSEEISEPKPEVKEVEIEIPVKEPEQKITPPAPNAPKKRGRKKKIRPESIPVPTVDIPAQPSSKVFTVPKAQTYDNYLKYYDKIIDSTKEGEKPEVALIFDKFSEPEAFKALVESLRK